MSESLPLAQPFRKLARLTRRSVGSKHGGADREGPQWQSPQAPKWHIGAPSPEWTPLQKETHK